MKVIASYGMVKEEDPDGDEKWIVIAEFSGFKSEADASLAMKQVADLTRSAFSRDSMAKILQNTTALSSGILKQ